MPLYTLRQLLLASLISPVLGTGLVAYNQRHAPRVGALLTLALGPVPLLFVAWKMHDSLLFNVVWVGLEWPDYVRLSLSSPAPHWSWAGAALWWLLTPMAVAVGTESSLAAARSEPGPAFARLCIGALAVSTFLYFGMVFVGAIGGAMAG